MIIIESDDDAEWFNYMLGCALKSASCEARERRFVPPYRIKLRNGDGTLLCDVLSMELED